MYCITTPQRVRPAPKRRADARVRFYLRSDQIGLSLPSPPRHCACGMGIVHTRLTREVSDSPAGVVSELSSRRIRGIGVDVPYVRIYVGRVWKRERERERESKDVRWRH